MHEVHSIHYVGADQAATVETARRIGCADTGEVTRRVSALVWIVPTAIFWAIVALVLL